MKISRVIVLQWFCCISVFAIVLGGMNIAQAAKKGSKSSVNFKWRITSENFEEIKAKAQAGDPDYQILLGEAYLNGRCVKADREEGHKWIKLALAENAKDPIGLYHLGVIYEYDLKDELAAQKYFSSALGGIRKLANRGNPRAQFILGVMYSVGRGVEEDRVESDVWIKKAADQEHPGAQFFMGVFLQSKDLKGAMDLFEKSAKQGNLSAIQQLAAFYFNGYIGDKSIVDYEKCFYWSQKHAEYESSWGFFRLAELYMNDNVIRSGLNMKLEELRLFYQGIELGEEYELATSQIEYIDGIWGLFLPVKLKWRGVKDVMINRDLDALVTRFIEGEKAGMGDLSRGLFDKALKDDPNKKDSFDFWFDYAHNANIAGQSYLALKAVKGMREVISKTEDEELVKEMSDIAAILEANALIGMDREKEAYVLLFEHGKLENDTKILVNYINSWAKLLLKDKKKLAFATGISESLWTGEYYRSENTQSFHDIETGELINPPKTTYKEEKKDLQPTVPTAYEEKTAVGEAKKEDSKDDK